MPKIEKPPFHVTRIVVHKGTANEREQWKLDGRQSFFGKRLREFHDTKKAATESGEKQVAETMAHGTQRTPLTDLERTDAVRALKLLNDKTQLIEAVEYFKTHCPDQKAITVSLACEEFLETRGITRNELYKIAHKRSSPEERAREHKGFRRSHRSALLCQIKPFIKEFGKRKVKALSVDEEGLQSWLEKRDPNIVSRDNRRRAIHSFFNFCIQKKYCVENPAKRTIQLTKEIKNAKSAKAPPITTPGDVEKLLIAARRDEPSILAPLVIAAFMGLRSSELDGLRWADINIADGIIHITSELGKTRERRDLKINEILAAWLAVCVKTPKKIPKRKGMQQSKEIIYEEKVALHDFAKRRAAICKKIDISWKNNMLRHSFGSYRFAQNRNYAETADEMRHSIDTFKMWYLNRGISNAQAKAYWEILPK